MELVKILAVIYLKWYVFEYNVFSLSRAQHVAINNGRSFIDYNYYVQTFWFVENVSTLKSDAKKSFIDFSMIRNIWLGSFRIIHLVIKQNFLQN